MIFCHFSFGKYIDIVKANCLVKAIFQQFPATKNKDGDCVDSQTRNLSTKKPITSHLKSLNMKKTMTYEIGNPGPGSVGTGTQFGGI